MIHMMPCLDLRNTAFGRSTFQQLDEAQSLPSIRYKSPSRSKAAQPTGARLE